MKDHRTLDVAEAQRYVAGNVKSVTRLAGAGITDVFEVVTDERSVVVKLFPPGYESKLAKEVFAYRLIEEHAAAVPVPRILGAHQDDHVLVLERIEGLPASSLADDDVPKLYRELGRLLAHLHGIELEAFGYLTAVGVVEPHATNLEYMRSEFVARLASFTELGGDATLGQAIAEHMLEREELLIGRVKPSFCHNDCHEGNVLVTPGANVVAGLFDFENALAGDPLLDLAKTVAYSPRDRSVITDAIADGYGGDLPAHWRDSLDLYGLYHVLELWTWLASLGVRDQLDALADDLAERIS